MEGGEKKEVGGNTTLKGKREKKKKERNMGRKSQRWREGKEKNDKGG